MQNKDSQRNSVIEVVEIIANLIAIESHCTELYQNKVSDLAHPELFTDEDIAKLQEEAAELWKERVEALNKRRDAMRILKSMALEYNSETRCKLKHWIWVYQFTQELVDTDVENEEYIEFAEWAYANMMKTLSAFLWIEPVTCGRCVGDELSK